MTSDRARDESDIDPAEFLRRMLAISAEDAAEAREDAARAVGPKRMQEGPINDYGEG